MCFKCFNDDCETAYIDNIGGPVVFMSTKKLYYFEILTGKTLTDCEEPAVSSETEAGGSDPASQI